MLFHHFQLPAPCPPSHPITFDCYLSLCLHAGFLEGTEICCLPQVLDVLTRNRSQLDLLLSKPCLNTVGFEILLIPLGTVPGQRPWISKGPISVRSEPR